MGLTTARLIIDPPQDGVWNMSLDQALLESMDDDPQITLRLYRWTPATLSLGYFQKNHERSEHALSSSLPVVRRASGGGAIVHDDELTYSLFVPTVGRFSNGNRDIYDLVHGCAIQVLSEFGIRANLYVQAEEQSPPNPNPFLCFQRRADGDLILGGFKVGGSAQRRSKSAVLQHGSFLLATSKHAPELPGIKEISGVTLNIDDFADRFVKAFGSAKSLQFVKWEIPARVAQRASEIGKSRFGNETWTKNR